MEEGIYLDNNASTPIDPRVLNAVVDILENHTGNASSIHSYGRALQKKLVMARDIVARYLGVKPKEIFFNSGGTEGMNTILKMYFDENPRGHIITSDLEHPCVFNTVKFLESKGLSVTYLSPGKYGAPTPEDVEDAIQPNTSLIALMAANNETGVITNIDGVAAVAMKHEIPFLVDAIALVGKKEFTIPEGVTALCLSGHKVHAPKGVGVTFVRRRTKFSPLLIGGGHEQGRRAGTENISGIVGFGKAIELLDTELPESTERMTQLRDKFESELLRQLSGISINGEGPRTCNTSNIAFSGVEGETLLANLDMQGLAVSHGSACSSGALEPSRVLLNMGISRELAMSSIRFSLSRMTTEAEIDRAIAIVVSVVERLRGQAKRSRPFNTR